MEKKSQKPYLTDYNLLIAQDLWQAIFKIKCIYEHDNKKCETCEIKYKDCNCFLEYTNFEEHLIKCKCLRCNKNYNFYNFYI